MTRFKVIKICDDQYDVWDYAIPSTVACYDKEWMAQDHVKRLIKSYNKKMKGETA